MAEKAWKTKALAVMYGQALGISISGSNNVMHSPIANGVLRTPKSSNKSNAVSAVGLDIELEDLMKLPEVIEYVELMERAISEKVKDNSVIPSPMHKRLSLGNALSPVRMPQYKTPGVGGKSRVSLGLPRIQERSSYDSHISEGEGDAAHFKFNSDSTEMLLLDSQDPEEAERMVEKLVNVS